MKIKQALAIIKASEKPPVTDATKKTEGFIVHFEKKDRSILRTDYFPDKQAVEKLIKTEALAWWYAKRFAAATDDTVVNIYVVDHNFSPVEGYNEKTLRRN